MTRAALAQGRGRRSTVARVALAAAATLLAAEGAVFLLSPPATGIEPLPVDARDYFGETMLDRARAFRSGQRLLLVAGLAAQAIAVGALAVGRPRAVRQVLGRLASRHVAGPALAGALVVAVAAVAALPFELIAHDRAVEAGLSTQERAGWLWDHARSTAITALMVAVGATLLAALVRRWARRWWLPGAALVTAFAAASTLLAPVLVAPLFNDFSALAERSEARRSVMELGRRAGIEIGDVLRVDASRRSTTLNAYVAGLGPTKRVVLYDNLIEDVRRDELESVVAHELAHVANRDIPRGILFAALVAPFGLVFARELAGVLARRCGRELHAAPGVPALLLSVVVASVLVQLPANQLSRRVEASADAYALRLTGDGKALVRLQVRLARANLSDPQPPALARLAFGTHPTALERIGAGLAYERAKP